MNILKQSKKTLEFKKSDNSLIRHRKSPNLSDHKNFFSSEFPTQITIFRNSIIRASADKIRNKYSNLEPQPTSNNLINIIKPTRLSLESKIVNLFIYRLYNLTELQKELINTASHNLNRDISVLTSFAISEQQKLQLLEVILENIKVDAKVKFQITRDFSLGIELRDHCYTIFSNLDICITELDKKADIQVGEKKSYQKELILRRQVGEMRKLTFPILSPYVD